VGRVDAKSVMQWSVCRRCVSEPPASGARVAQVKPDFMRATVAIACNEGLACVFDFGSAFVCKVKNHDKHEARSDQQARIIWAA